MMPGPKKKLILRWGILISAVWMIPVLLQLHGFSITLWRTHLDNSPHEEVLLGHAQSVRSDDSVAVLPHILSQTAHRPPFPARNTLIGDGTYDMQVNYAVPVLSPITLFRPQLWGYFISPDTGLAWNWWFYVFGTWTVLFLLLKWVTQDNLPVAIAAATALLYAPFFQYWSLNCAPSVIYFGGVLLASIHLYLAQTSRAAWTASAVLAWFTVAFLLTFGFTPYLITLLYLALFVFAGVAIEHRNSVNPQTRTARLLGIALSIGAAAAIVVGLLSDSRDTITTIRDSVYPGHRLSYGGDAMPADLFRGNTLSILRLHDWGRYGNICEASSFFLFFPLVAMRILWDAAKKITRPTPVQCALILYLIAATLWQFFRFPDWLVRWTLMDRVPTRRALLGIGIADTLLLASYVSTRCRAARPFRIRQAAPWFFGLLWLVFVIAMAGSLAGALPDITHRAWVLSCGVTTALGWSVIAWPRSTLPALAILSVACTLWFNPLVRGGTAFILNNPLSRMIVELDGRARTEGRIPLWIAYGRDRHEIYVPNLCRMLGVRSLNGVHTYPQKGLWRVLDPEGASEGVWNRYAHVRFSLPDDRDAVAIKLLQGDLILVELHPEHPRFAAMGVDYLLYSGDAADLGGVRNLVKLYSYAGTHIFSVAPIRSGAHPESRARVTGTALQ